MRTQAGTARTSQQGWLPEETLNTHTIMAAPEINNVMVQLEGMISDEIYSRGLHTSPWFDLPVQENWPEGQGHILQALTLGRSLPRNPLSWDPITVSDGGAGGTCIPPVQRLEITNSVKEYSMAHTSLESPDLCLLDLLNAFKAEEQMGHLMEVLSENTRQVWIHRNRSEYTRLATNKFVATTTGFLAPVDGDFAATLPTSKLGGGHLKRAAKLLTRSGAGKNSYGMVDGKPTFLALIGMEASEDVATETEYRKDIRETNRVSELLAPLGIERMFRNLWMSEDIFPPRYNLVGGTTWVEVPAYVWVGTGAAAELVENPSYETAEAEDTIIYHPDVLRSLVLPPARSHGQAKFDPQTYRGDWSWKNIIHRDENPDGNYGFFRGVFANGSKPKFPQYGIVIRHLRCDIPILGGSCAVGDDD
jgi:hypothetical protein